MNLRLFSVAALLSALAACAPKPKVDEAAVFGAIEANLKAMQAEDLAGVMATVHPQGENLEATREIFEEIFAKYDFQYTISNLKVADVKGDEVFVTFVQRTERTGGANDRPDNIMEGVHTLKKDGETWKLLRTTALRVTPLKRP